MTQNAVSLAFWAMNSLLFLIALVTATPANEFHFNNGAEPEGLDPHRSQSHDAAQLNYQMFEQLIGRKNDYFTLRPGLAESWKVSKDGLTWTLKIRPHLKWSNGEPLTLEHIRGSFVRAMDPSVAAPYVNWYTDFIVGAADVVANYNKPGKADAIKNLGVKIVGTDTIEIKLTKPVAFFGHLLTNPVFAIIHPNLYATDSKGWRTAGELISNGAYMLTEWKVNQRIVMEKNPHYWDVANVKIPKLVSYPINDQQTTLNMYNAGQLDWTGENTLNPSIVNSLKSRKDFQYDSAFGTYIYVFNTKKKPFDNPKIRLAFSLAINTPEITDKISKSGVVPAYRLVPPGIPSYKEAVGLPTDMKVRLEKAKALLAEAGYPNGKGLPQITLLYNTTESHHRIAQAIQRMWKEGLGVNVLLKNGEWKVVLAEQKAGNFDIVRFAWIGDFPDPSTFIEFLQTGSDNNNGKFSSKDVDENLRLANMERDPAKRFKLLAKAEKALLDEAAIAPIYHYVWYSLMSPKIGGFKTNMFGHYDFKEFKKN